MHNIQPNISIFNTNYNTQDNTYMHDYIHVTNLTTTHIATLTHYKTNNYQTCNLDTNHNVNINELITQTRTLTNHKIHTIASPQQPNDPPILITDVSLTHQTLD
jgi:UDP-glucose 4-epimerase